jgi:hypothetical protein
MAALSDFTCACAVFINARAAERRAIILLWNIGRCKDGSRRWRRGRSVAIAIIIIIIIIIIIR